MSSALLTLIGLPVPDESERAPSSNVEGCPGPLCVAEGFTGKRRADRKDHASLHNATRHACEVLHCDEWLAGRTKSAGHERLKAISRPTRFNRDESVMEP